MRATTIFGASIFALLASTSVLAQSPAAASASAAEPDSSDIIVTAAKREQTLQDVPISVSVTSQATVERSQIRDLIDLQSVVPSLKVAQFNGSSQTNFIIRGFGNGNGNDGIESSVGVFIDGVYRSRSASALDDLPEIERIEVLRGPQSTLFGKNVSAGAISIVTKKPQFNFGAKAEVSLSNYGGIQSKATITGPISETLAVRLSGSVNERDGYFRNVVTGSDINDRNRWSLRGDVLWQPSADLSVRVIGDYNLIKERCCGVVQIFNGPATQAIGAPVALGGLGKPIGNDKQPFAQNVVLNPDPVNRLRGYGVSGQIDLNTGIGKLTSITAYRNQVSTYAQDVDFSGADLADRSNANEISTFTQEFRLASDGSGPLNYLVGGFYEDEKLTTGTQINFGKDIRAYADALSGKGSFGSNIRTLEVIQRGGIFGIPLNAAIVPGSTYFQAGQAIRDQYHVSQRSYSLFGQLDFKPIEQLTLTAGAAYLNDRKAVIADVVLTDPFSKLNLSNIPNLAFLGSPVNAFAALGGLQFFYGNTANHGPINYPNANESGIFKGDKFTYAGRAAYDFGVINAYVSYSTGWKAAAVNLSYDSRPPGLVVGRGALPESVTVYEAGLKAKVREGFLNLAVFKQSIKNFQSNAYNGVGFDLINAEKESVRGVEFDAAYNPLPWLNITGAATYLDAKYDLFRRGNCYSFDQAAGLCKLDAATGVFVRDRTGQVPSGIPEWSVSTSATVSHKFTDGLDGYIRGEFDYASNAQLTETTPAQYSTSGISMVNASIGFTDSDAKLEVMAWARNLTNDHALIATFPTVAQSGSYSGYPVQPRTYGVTLRKTF